MYSMCEQVIFANGIKLKSDYKINVHCIFLSFCEAVSKNNPKQKNPGQKELGGQISWIQHRGIINPLTVTVRYLRAQTSDECEQFSLEWPSVRPWKTNLIPFHAVPFNYSAKAGSMSEVPLLNIDNVITTDSNKALDIFLSIMIIN